MGFDVSIQTRLNDGIKDYDADRAYVFGYALELGAWYKHDVAVSLLLRRFVEISVGLHNGEDMIIDDERYYLHWLGAAMCALKERPGCDFRLLDYDTRGDEHFFNQPQREATILEPLSLQEILKCE